jgi:4-hydroxymandelate oxidase
MTFRNVSEMHAAARDKLDPAIYDYYAGAAMDEITLADNSEAFEQLQLHYSVLKGVGTRSTETTVLGQIIDTPIMLAPVAFQKMAHADGELASVRAAHNAGTIMIVSTLSTTEIELLTLENPGKVWFQLYIEKDRNSTTTLIKRAEAAGCSAIVVTVDSPVSGRLERIMRTNFQVPPEFMARNFLPAKLKRLPHSMVQKINQESFENRLDANLTWDDIGWLISNTNLPVVVKGIVRADDAMRAVEQGAKGVIVSNHGGRQLDTAPATIDVLAQIVDAVGDQCDVLMDSGIRRGNHCFKALAMGAKAVLIGRPIIWGLAVDGQAGVSEVMSTLQAELDNVMAVCGCSDIHNISPDLVRRKRR